MRSKIAFGLFVLAFVAASRTADASVIVFTFSHNGDDLTFAADGTVRLIDKNAGRTCSYTLAPRDKQQLFADFRDADVQSALRANAVVSGSAARLLSGARAVDWAPGAHATGTVALRRFYFELVVQTLKARIMCMRSRP